MGLDDLNEMHTFSKNIAQVYTTKLGLIDLRFYCNKCVQNVKAALEMKDHLIIYEGLIEGSEFNFNHFTELFIDLTTLISISSGKGAPSTLAECISFYKSNRYDQLSSDGKLITDYIIKRNSMVHEYNKFEEIRANHVKIISLHGEGLIAITNDLEQFITDCNLLEVRLKRR